MHAMHKYKLLLQYDGTRYAGWQIQKNRETVQGWVKDALGVVTGESVSVVAAGRTDSGVHALGQVAHVVLGQAEPPLRLRRSLNGVLPADIRVSRVSRVPLRFHAQKDALRKRYEYRIYNGEVLSPFERGYILQVVRPLDAGAIEEAARCLLGRHDFSGFAAASTGVRDRTRTVFHSSLKKKGRRLYYRIEADGFLHHMVRNIVGTLLQIGSQRRPPEDMEIIRRSADRRQAGATAPAHGLYLVRVWY